MDAKTAVLDVDGTSYKVTALNTTPMLELYDELREVLGESIQEAMAKGGSAEAIASRVIFGALTAMPRGMLVRLGKIFAPTTELGLQATGSVGTVWVKLEGELYEQHFATKPAHWTKWVIACLKHNYSDFLDAFQNSIGAKSAAVEATKSASKSPAA
jgi:hypothetical protein